MTEDTRTDAEKARDIAEYVAEQQRHIAAVIGTLRATPNTDGVLVTPDGQTVAFINAYQTDEDTTDYYGETVKRWRSRLDLAPMPLAVRAVEVGDIRYTLRGSRGLHYEVQPLREETDDDGIRESRGGGATVMGWSDSFGRTEGPRVNWSAWGAQDAATTAIYAAVLTAAADLARFIEETGADK